MKKIEECKVGDLIVFTQPKKYTFVGRAGRGGTGKAIVLEDTILNKKFVSKMYEPYYQEDKKEFYSRFVDEIKIMFNIYHDNIVRIYDYFLYPEYFTGYIMMEFVNGIDISEYFNNRNKDKINSIFIQLIQAFAYLETKKILHRDIGPSNIMIDENDNVKLIDFGFGKQVKNLSDQNASIILNWPVATFPNEINKGIYNAKTEIYFLGCLLKEIISNNEISSFKYPEILDDMTIKDDKRRINSFDEINQILSNNSILNFNFSNDEKNIYQNFVDELINSISVLINERKYETNINILLDKLNDKIVKNSLETYVIDSSSIISCFINSGYNDSYPN
jgi:serine/threonine-protein kinase